MSRRWTDLAVSYLLAFALGMILISLPPLWRETGWMLGAAVLAGLLLMLGMFADTVRSLVLSQQFDDSRPPRR